MLKIFIVLLAAYAINGQTLLRQNWNWVPSGQFVEHIETTSFSPPTPPSIPSIDLNASLDSLINQLNILIRLRNERRQNIRQWNQSLFEKQTFTGVNVSFDQIDYSDDPWDVVITRLIGAVVSVITKAVASASVN